MTLLPCPFCGGAAAFDNSDTGPSEWVFCTKCGATSSERNPNHKGCTSAEEAWNTRHPATPDNTTNASQNIALTERAAIVIMLKEKARLNRVEGNYESMTALVKAITCIENSDCN